MRGGPRAVAEDGHQRAAGAGLPASVGGGGHYAEEQAEGLGKGRALPVLALRLEEPGLGRREDALGEGRGEDVVLPSPETAKKGR